ncbi:MAG: YybH family protein [Gemmatimonadaceae bacterium]
MRPAGTIRAASTAVLIVVAAATAAPTQGVAQQPSLSVATYSGFAVRTTARAATVHVADTAQVRAVIQAVFRAAERQDVAALDTLYAGDSLTVIEGAGINRGWADYRDHHLVPELSEMKGLEYRPDEIAVHIRGDLAWSLFRYTLVAQSAGRTADVIGRGTAILERHDTPHGSRWVLRHIHTSGRARRPTDPPRSPA